MSSYEATLDWLLRLESGAGWDLKLERVRQALALRGHPEGAFASVHIAGTNGKGSTSAMVESVLRASGRRTGLYTSPHLVDFTERIRAGGRTIPRETVVTMVAELRDALERAGQALTHFEFCTVLAFEWFARIGVEVAVVEVGLGGRLDATNVIAPLATAITSIAHDHEEWLGHDLASIAAEKAGILKAGVPSAIGRLPPEAVPAVTARANALGVPLLWAGRDTVLDGTTFRGPDVWWDDLRVPLPGAFQHANAEVALTLLAAASDELPCDVAAVRAGLARAQWPGRLALVEGPHPPVLLDGAHNPAGVDALVAELPALLRGRPMVLVFAVMADKAWRAMLARLVPCAREAIVTQVGRRGLDPQTVAAALAGRLPSRAIVDPRAAIAAGLAAAGDDGVVVVTGSLFLVGEAYAVLGGPDARLFEPWQAWEADASDAPP